jgi:hypothetical protein
MGPLAKTSHYVNANIPKSQKIPYPKYIWPQTFQIRKTQLLYAWPSVPEAVLSCVVSGKGQSSLQHYLPHSQDPTVFHQSPPPAERAETLVHTPAPPLQSRCKHPANLANQHQGKLLEISGEDCPH